MQRKLRTIVCDACHGLAGEACPDCKGSGQALFVECCHTATSGEIPEFSVRCPACGGTGRETCAWCEGTGYRKVTWEPANAT